MVIVEFFSRSPVDNMISTLVNRPETLVFVGDPKQMRQWDPVFRRFLAATGNTATQLLYRETQSHDFHEIVHMLEQLVLEYPGCHFDITGGEPMILAAIGVIYERYRSRGIQLHQYNIPTGQVYDCDLSGTGVSGDIPLLTVEQNIILHGGSVVTGKNQEAWDLNSDFLRDISVIWNLCRVNCSGWNKRINKLNTLAQYAAKSPDGLRLTLSRSALKAAHPELRPEEIVRPLSRGGLLLDLTQEEDALSFRYKNRQVKQCLEKAGTALELYTCATALSLRGKGRKPCYRDGRIGVSIDWDGVLHAHTSGTADTNNEIDVILMQGAVPVFISCKNGVVAEDELFKLNTVADRFGGRYVKKVLIATTLGKRTARSKQYFLERAKDMGITVIDGVHKLSEQEFREQLRLLAKN